MVLSSVNDHTPVSLVFNSKTPWVLTTNDVDSFAVHVGSSSVLTLSKSLSTLNTNVTIHGTLTSHTIIGSLLTLGSLLVNETGLSTTKGINILSVGNGNVTIASMDQHTLFVNSGAIAQGQTITTPSDQLKMVSSTTSVNYLNNGPIELYQGVKKTVVLDNKNLLVDTNVTVTGAFTCNGTMTCAAVEISSVNNVDQICGNSGVLTLADTYTSHDAEIVLSKTSGLSLMSTNGIKIVAESVVVIDSPQSTFTGQGTFDKGLIVNDVFNVVNGPVVKGSQVLSTTDSTLDEWFYVCKLNTTQNGTGLTENGSLYVSIVNGNSVLTVFLTVNNGIVNASHQVSTNSTTIVLTANSQGDASNVFVFKTGTGDYQVFILANCNGPTFVDYMLVTESSGNAVVFDNEGSKVIPDGTISQFDHETWTQIFATNQSSTASVALGSLEITNSLTLGTSGTTLTPDTILTNNVVLKSINATDLLFSNDNIGVNKDLVPIDNFRVNLGSPSQQFNDIRSRSLNSSSLSTINATVDSLACSSAIFSQNVICQESLSCVELRVLELANVKGLTVTDTLTVNSIGTTNSSSVLTIDTEALTIGGSLLVNAAMGSVSTPGNLRFLTNDIIDLNELVTVSKASNKVTIGAMETEFVNPVQFKGQVTCTNELLVKKLTMDTGALTVNESWNENTIFDMIVDEESKQSHLNLYAPGPYSGINGSNHTCVPKMSINSGIDGVSFFANVHLNEKTYATTVTAESIFSDRIEIGECASSFGAVLKIQAQPADTANVILTDATGDYFAGMYVDNTGFNIATWSASTIDVEPSLTLSPEGMLTVPSVTVDTLTTSHLTVGSVDIRDQVVKFTDSNNTTTLGSISHIANTHALEVSNTVGDVTVKSSGGNGLTLAAVSGNASFNGQVNITCATSIDTTQPEGDTGALNVVGGAVFNKSVLIGNKLVIGSIADVNKRVSLVTPSTLTQGYTLTLPESVPSPSNDDTYNLVLDSATGSLRWQKVVVPKTLTTFVPQPEPKGVKKEEPSPVKVTQEPLSPPVPTPSVPPAPAPVYGQVLVGASGTSSITVNIPFDKEQPMPYYMFGNVVSHDTTSTVANSFTCSFKELKSTGCKVIVSLVNGSSWTDISVCVHYCVAH